MNGYKEIPVTYMRGGTSKGAYLLKDTLPTDPARRDRMILDLYGSPDARQINGIGGADPLTSKVAIVNPSDRDDADIDYTFGYFCWCRGICYYGRLCESRRTRNRSSYL